MVSCYLGLISSFNLVMREVINVSKILLNQVRINRPTRYHLVALHQVLKNI